jgi:hypothetical protein
VPLRIERPDPSVFAVRGFDFYVRLDTHRRASMLEAVKRSVGSEGTVYDQGSHAVVLWQDFHPPEPLLARLSGELNTQVIWLAFQKQVDAFGYERWEGGQRLRRLVFGCYEKERTWEQVDGEPEAWEAAAIFEESRLERRLAWRSELGGDLTPSRNEQLELRELWRQRKLIVDCDEPSINGRDVAEAVAVAYSLPGWD